MQTRPPAGAQRGGQTDVGWEDQTWPGSLSWERDWWTPDAWAWRGCGSSLGQQWGGGEAGLGHCGWPRASPAPTQGGQLPVSSRSSSSGWSWGSGPETRGCSVTSEDTGRRCPEPRGHPAEPRRAWEATCLNTEMKPLLTGVSLVQGTPDDHPRSGLLRVLLNRNVPRTITHDDSTHQEKPTMQRPLAELRLPSTWPVSTLRMTTVWQRRTQGADHSARWFLPTPST